MITGSIVALVTPMRSDGALDHEALAKAVDRVIEAGSAAIVSVGTTGESATLDVDEHTDVIRRTIDVAAGRVPIIAGTGANSTTEAIHLTEAAKAAGADAALLVTPYYNKPPQEGLYRHFKAVAEAVDIPQILYNVPGRTAVDMLPATVERLAELPAIVGIKEAKGDLERVRELVALGCPISRSTPATTPPPATASCSGSTATSPSPPTWRPRVWPACARPRSRATPRPPPRSTPTSRPCTARCSSSPTRSPSSGRSPSWA